MPLSIDDTSQQQLTDLAEQLLARGWTVTTAESCTGGGVAATLTTLAGSSRWFEAGFVTYSNRMKTALLDVPATIIEQHGAVSEPVVLAMVDGALAQSGAQLAVAISGIAGPEGGSAAKPVGTVWFAWGLSSGARVTDCPLLPGTRAEVRDAAVARALAGLLTLLNEQA